MAELINVNGTIASAEKATVPVLDHGFLYGDSIYETIRTYRGRPYLLDRHLDRLERSASAIRLTPPQRAEVERETRRTIAEAANDESYVRIMVTRGVGPIGYERDLCPRPGLFVIVMPLRHIPPRTYEEGIAATVGRRRRNPRESLDPAIKSCNLLNNVLAHMEAEDAGSRETILLNTRGFVAEGTHTNVFFVKGGVLRTPALACGLLSGITREVLIEAARDAAIPCEEGEYEEPALFGADEVFVTSTLQEVMPVVRLNGRPVGAGVPGPLTRRLHALFLARVESQDRGR
ncbi:MAG TPA: aminotransferase class IV [Verrucomicrobiae bacterium]|nr:aminotransferase class IV [Verrucomicrobiae bacterium]